VTPVSPAKTAAKKEGLWRENRGLQNEGCRAQRPARTIGESENSVLPESAVDCHLADRRFGLGTEAVSLSADEPTKPWGGHSSRPKRSASS